MHALRYIIRFVRIKQYFRLKFVYLVYAWGQLCLNSIKTRREKYVMICFFIIVIARLFQTHFPGMDLKGLKPN